jgi:hypothetical protein
MPPRTITLGIVALWLAALGWMAYREWWREPEPPPLLDRTDEVGKQSARWRIWVNREKVGHVVTPIGRPKDAPLFALRADLTFVPEFTFRGDTIKVLKSAYRVTPRGQLRKLTCKVALGENEAEVRGEIDDAGFRATADRKLPNGPASEQVRAEGRLGAFNLLHPLHRLAGLYEGRQWDVMAIDPLTLALQKRTGEPDSGFFAMTATTVSAKVSWDEQLVPCWRVDFRKGGGVYAQVWARLDDGLVLRQQVNCGGGGFDLEREPDHAPKGRLPGPQFPRLAQ